MTVNLMKGTVCVCGCVGVWVCVGVGVCADDDNDRECSISDVWTLLRRPSKEEDGFCLLNMKHTYD